MLTKYEYVYLFLKSYLYFETSQVIEFHHHGRSYLFYVTNVMVADDQVAQGAKASVGMILTLLWSLDILFPVHVG